MVAIRSESARLALYQALTFEVSCLVALGSGFFSLGLRSFQGRLQVSNPLFGSHGPVLGLLYRILGFSKKS